MGSFVESTLGDGEIVKYEAKVSAWSLAPLIILGIVTLPFLIGVIFLAGALIRYNTTELVVTNRKVLAKFGLIKRNSIEILITKIESVRLNQGILGRIFNYGDIILAGAGTPQEPIIGISDPLGFRRRFIEIQEQATN